jgi:hypothetical protein
MPLELLVGAAVGAGLASESGRKAIRKGLVYGMAGALMAYDRMTALAAEVRGARNGGKESAAPSSAPKDAPSSETASPQGASHSTPEPLSRTDQAAETVTSR